MYRSSFDSINEEKGEFLIFLKGFTYKTLTFFKSLINKLVDYTLYIHILIFKKNYVNNRRKIDVFHE